jgi:hypothetical protein
MITDNSNCNGFGVVLYGISSTKGKVIVKPKYRNIDDFSDGLAVVEKDGKFGIINTKGKVIVEPQYDYIMRERFYDRNFIYHNLPDGLAVVKKNGKYGIINTSNGKVIAKPQYDNMGSFSDVFAEVQKDDEWGIINISNGKVIAKPGKYHNWSFLGEGGLIKVYKNGESSIINEKGEVVKELSVYDYIDYFSDGLAEVQKDDKCGYINTDGALVIETIYDYAGSFNNGYALVEKDGTDMIINKKGEVINTK